MLLADFRVLIVPGLHNSGHDHWQSRWQQLYPSFERVEQMQWNTPALHAWSEQVHKALRQSPRPALIVAHSFGCLATIHCAGMAAPNLAGALLVAPADPDRFGIANTLCHARLDCPSIVISSNNDPWMESERAAFGAAQWGSQFIDVGALGHINAESDLGDWVFGLAQLQRLGHLAKRRMAEKSDSARS